MKIEYKDWLSEAYSGEVRKLSHYTTKEKIIGITPMLFNRVMKPRKPNHKRRIVVQKRIAKLQKYIKRAWNGYSFGRVKAK